MRTLAAIFAFIFMVPVASAQTTIYQAPSLPWNNPGASGNGGVSIRDVIPVTGPGSSIQITVVSDATHSVTYDHLAVGIQSSGANTVSTPVPLTFGGSSSITVAAGASATSDASPLTFNGGALIVVADIDAATPYLYSQTGTSGVMYYKSATQSYNQSSVSGFSTSSGLDWIVLQVIATGSPPPPPPPPPAVAAGVTVAFPFTRPSSADLLAGTVPNPMPANDTQQTTDRWQFMVARHDGLQNSVPSGSVAVIGDSIVQMMDLSSCSPFAVNYGIASDTAGGYLNRIGSYTSLHNAHAVVLELPGLNDLSANIPVSTVEANIMYLINWFTPTDENPLIIVKITPTTDATLNAKTAQINSWIDAAVFGRRGIIVFDPNPAINAAGGAAANTWDGTHPNLGMQAIWCGGVAQDLGVQ